jgi:hypothetical protein
MVAPARAAVHTGRVAPAGTAVGHAASRQARDVSRTSLRYASANQGRAPAGPPYWGVHLLVEAGCPPVAHALVQGPGGGHEPGGVEGEDRGTALAGAQLQLPEQRTGDAVAAMAGVHRQRPAARPAGGPAQVLVAGVGVEGDGADDLAVHDGDEQRAAVGVPVEVEQVTAVGVPHRGVEQRADRGVVRGSGRAHEGGGHGGVSLSMSEVGNGLAG